MWRLNTINNPKLVYSLIISACLNLLLMPLALWNFVGLKENILNEQTTASIVTSVEDEEFLRKVSEDLGLENEIIIVIGPRYVNSFFSLSLNNQLDKLLSEHPIIMDPADPTRRILIEKNIYDKLSVAERQAAIAHSVGHVYSFIKNGYVAKPRLESEIEANGIAIRYVNPNILINLYVKYGSDYDLAPILIDDLERQILIGPR